MVEVVDCSWIIAIRWSQAHNFYSLQPSSSELWKQGSGLDRPEEEGQSNKEDDHTSLELSEDNQKSTFWMTIANTQNYT